MKFPEPKTFRGATSPMIMASWFFAIGIFEYPIGHPRPLMSLCWSITHFSLFLGFVMVAESNNLTQAHIAKVSLGTFHLFLLASIISVMVSLCFGRTKSKNVMSSLCRINTVNKMLRMYEIPNEYGSTFKYQIIQLISAFIFTSIMLATNIFWIAYHRHFQIIHFGYLATVYYITICSFIVDCTFANLMRYVGKRFQYLNANILQFSFQKNNKNSFLQDLEADGPLPPTVLEIHVNPYSFRLAEKQTMLNLIWNSRQIHRELCSVASTLNEAFGVQILLSMTISCVSITALFHGIYDICLDSTSTSADNSFIKIFIIVSWLIFYIVKVLHIVHVCSMTSAQAQQMGELIYQLDTPTIDRQVREEIHAFSLLLMQNPPRFTASGFFSLDYGMIRSMVGTVTSYLVIMIQLHSTYDSKSGSTNATC